MASFTTDPTGPNVPVHPLDHHTMTTVAPTTRVDAVNRMLSVIGESTITTITPYSSLTATVQRAVDVLNEIDLETQMRGWHFNFDTDVKLNPDVNGFISVPPSVARISVKRSLYPNLDITIRDNVGTLSLYDKKGQTFVLPAIKADIVYLFDYEKTPEAYRRYVMCEAGRVFQDRVLGSGPHHVFNAQDAAKALRFLKQHEDFAKPSSIFDSYDAFRAIDRRYPNVTGSATL